MRLLILLGALAVLCPPAVEAQIPLEMDPGRSERTRADLEGQLARFEEFLLSPAYSESLKRSVRANAELIRARLENGDFRLGDRVVLSVQGEASLQNDTISVQAGPLIPLPLFGDIPLRGVLRSEVQEHITVYLRSFIREPVVRAQGLMRVSIQGAVGRPGFYVVPAHMLVTEALMAAGGPSSAADLEALRVERGPDVLVGGDELQLAMREGWSLDQLNLQAGDQVVLPERGGGIFGNLALMGSVIGSMSILLFQLFR